ncbi:LON peptidase substrate-binding domain-containing protein [Opitutales bacterium ASA1]|uniref:LON peptidase substrate-binding domain-containing protein n=1 Tax=Congregicoccus parvus TaxID=3081749 RepID=UPI002B28400E|nr:LON peptidase substrate-binding domain-containing protein [Opitutales bacterium ASA1]
MQLRPPDEVPVMTLPNTVFFPGIALPLHIFEPRYRCMLSDVLKSHRMFAVAALDASRIEFPHRPEPLHEVASVGIVRACRKSEDGTSDLVLERLTRVRVQRIVREHPYRVVAIEPLSSMGPNDETQAASLREQLLDTVRDRARLPSLMPPEFEIMLAGIEDASELCDIAVFALGGRLEFRQRMLETLDTAARIRATIRQLRQEIRAHEIKRIQDEADPDRESSCN